SIAKWTFNVENTDTLSLFFNELNREIPISINNHTGIYKKKFVKSVNYSVSLINNEIIKKGILNYSIEIIKDKYPSIKVNELKDSSSFYGRIFYGVIQDDYGLDSLFFTLKYLNEQKTERINIPINTGINQEFYFQYNFSEIPESTVVEYYFEVWDNDKINGSKKSISKIQSITKLSNREKEKQSVTKFNNIEKSINSAMSLSNEISNDLEKIRENLTSENMTEFEKDRAIKSIIQKKKDLEAIINNIKKEYKEKSVLDKLGIKDKEELAKKQQEIADLLENLLTDEIKKLIEELQKLRNEQGKDKELKSIAEKMEFNFDDLTKQINNSLEILKKMEVERKLEKSIEDLNNLAKDLKKEKFENKINDSIKKNIVEKKEEFNSIMDDYKKIQELNKELKNMLPLKDFKQDSNSIVINFDETIKSLEKNKINRASKKNKENSKKVQELSEKINDMLNNIQAQAIQVDIELLNSIIDNITQFSFDQEKLMVYGKTINSNNPLYSKIYTDQKNIAKEFKFINKQIDTLTEHTASITNIIRNDINRIEQKLLETNNYFENRQKSKIAVSQQIIMTSANNLLLKLDELLKSLMKNSKPGNGEKDKNCNKPSKPSPGISDLKKQQESFKSQLQDMIKQMKESKEGSPQNAELAKMLAEQEMYKQLLNEISNNNTIGNNTSKALNEIKKLVDENISDIIKARIDNNLLKRQDLIKTRLLKAEQSEREREVEKQRVAKENLSDKRSNPTSNFEYNKENYNFNELLKKKNVKFNEFYRKKANSYLKYLSEESK
ncbi:MAG: hypothetical protein GXO79_03890, partial [Chlorobi bacterium]|nr:hypothetical protein [Chlorobiota bacterium]